MDEVERYKKLQESASTLSNEKIRLDERYRSEKEKLAALLKEIEAKGYDPQKLAETKSAKEQELKEKLDLLESEIQEISEKLQAIEV
jgi:hypothetical protein